MRHAHYKLLPHRERPRHRVPASFPALYLQRRRRGRAAFPFNSPLDIAGLKLWLDAAVGLTGAWAAAPESASSWFDYSPSGGYTANGFTHGIRIYPFKTVASVRVYSAGFFELQATDDNSTQGYFINWSWSAVSGAEGYRVLKSDSGSGYTFDHSYDVIGESFVDTGAGLFGGDGTVSPLVVLGAASAGDAVTHWNDLSGLANHATPVSAGQCALFQPGVANGRPVLRFGSAAGYSSPLVLNTPCTIFAVYALRGAGDVARRAVAGSNNWLLGPYGTPNEFYTGDNFTGGPSVIRNRFIAQAGWQDGSASRNFVNGVFVGTPRGAGSGPGTVCLGAGGAYGEPLEGDLAEVIAYDSALGKNNLSNVWSYLAAKYALP